MDFPLSQYLEKYLRLTPPQKYIRDAVQGAVREILSIEIPSASIQCEKGVAFLVVHPILKQRVLEHEEELVIHIERALGKKVVRSIR
jgi:hypothetical protein